MGNLALKKKGKEKKSQSILEFSFFFKCGVIPILPYFPAPEMPVLDTTELKWESKLWFHTTIIGMFRFNMSATQG